MVVIGALVVVLGGSLVVMIGGSVNRRWIGGVLMVVVMVGAGVYIRGTSDQGVSEAEGEGCHMQGAAIGRAGARG